jgi:A/G-specific adenine glycosylase
MMELGATVCLPRVPICVTCPVSGECQARRLGIQQELPARKKKVMVRREHTLLVIRRNGRILLMPSPRVSGFWELPERVSGVRLGPKLGEFRHAITNSQYHFEVREARITTRPRECRWWDERELGNIPLSTASKKALRCLEAQRARRAPLIWGGN